MSDDRDVTTSEIIVSLGSDLRISRAAEVFDQLIAVANTAKTVVIDSGEIGKVDAAGLQAVVAAVMRFRSAGLAWRWRNESSVFRSAANMLGLADTLELPS